MYLAGHYSRMDFANMPPETHKPTLFSMPSTSQPSALLTTAYWIESLLGGLDKEDSQIRF